MSAIDKAKAAKEKVNKFINKIKSTIKKVKNAVKFFATPIGYVCGWILLILICIFLILVILKYVATIFKELTGDYTDYTTFEDDVGYIQDLVSSGYEATIDSENFQNFKAFEYAVLMDTAEYLRQEDNIDLMQVTSETDQSLIADVEAPQDTLDELVEKGIESRSLKVENEVPSIKVPKVVEGGNTKVTPPTLVYEFKKASIYRYSDESVKELLTKEEDKEEAAEEAPEETLTANSVLEASTEQLLAEGKLKGALEPYIYIIREDIDFTYYFNQNNNKNAKRVVEYKYELNINNPYMTGSGSEFQKELTRYNEENPNAKLGTVYPGQSYETRIFYTDVTTPVVYKIPLKTLIGRYMPKIELLQAWTTLKQDIDKEGDTETSDLVDEVIACIKGVYNEACLLGEEFTTVSSGDENGELTNYSDASTHNKTFVTFETAGIEKTLYGINGLKEAKGLQLKVFTSCVNAAIIEDKEVTAKVIYKDGTSGEVNFKISEIVDSGWKEHGCVIAQEADGGGYIAPSTFEIDKTRFCAVNTSVSKVISQLESAMKARLGADEVVTELWCKDLNEVVKKGAAFTFKDESPTHTLEIDHTRMPILLVKSATTWARQINYIHTLTQDGFDSNDKYYIIPNSVTSIGLINFQASLEQEKTYRGKAYVEIFARMKEKDVLNILLQLEEDAMAGSNDCYEYMRDVYKLMVASKEYSTQHESSSSTQGGVINPKTYTYLYIPDSILYYNDTLTQKIYWIDLFTAVQSIDAITAEELKNVRTRRNELTWQVVEYEKYPECNKNGKTVVYALNPFGSSYLRAYYQRIYEKEGYKATQIHGKFDTYDNHSGHSGSDWGGRGGIAAIYSAKSSESVDEANPEYASAIYNYELERLTTVYDSATAKEKINSELLEQRVNLPIVAVAPGIVDTVTYSSRSGIYVKIRHTKEDPAGDEVYTAYLHLKRWPLVEEGDYVGAGTLLGYEGETGRAFGSHLHYQIQKGGMVAPCEYTYPSFNPFYNAEQAEANGNDMSSEYMSLYRTVTLGDGSQKYENMHPEKALVDNFEDLLQNQGEFDKGKVPMSGELGWNDSFGDTQGYINYLKSNNYYDLYIKEVYTDYNLAKENGYLDIPSYLWWAIGATDFVVKTDMPSSLPELTREELVYILEYWLPARYGESTFKGVKKVDWLMQNVFTDENIDKIIEAQNKYHVSAVFALAVATIEQNMGLSGTKLALAPNYNIFSIKGSRNGGVRYQNGKLWNKYLGYGDAFEGFAQLIAVTGSYYKNDKYTIAQIAPTYCNEAWGVSVSKIVTNIMQYYIGSWETPFGMITQFGDGNDEFAKAAENCMNWLNMYKNSFSYGYSVKVPPYNGDFGAPKSSQMDCSGYVSWVIHEYGKANNIPELEKIGRWSTPNFKALGDAIRSGRDYQGVAKYFELIATRDDMPGGKISKVKDRLQAGDIILYKEGSGHHVEILKETGSTKVYTCGSKSGWSNPGAQSYTRRNDVTYIFRLKPGVK